MPASFVVVTWAWVPELRRPQADSQGDPHPSLRRRNSPPMEELEVVHFEVSGRTVNAKKCEN